MPDKKDYALLEFMNEHMRDTLDELQKRPVQAVATALIFAMSELIHQKCLACVHS